MSEKRFDFNLGACKIYDKQEKRLLEDTEVCGLLNEQQATISKQLDQIIELQDKYRILEFNHSRLENRNKAQYKKIGEQQATIEQLQAQLREKEEDEQLYANEILELREANKEFIQFKSLGGDY